MHRETWIFGYGSLIWRPAFRFEQMAPGYVVGWSRRFWQGSTDHRGVPGAPGRVVTLVPEPGARCWGIAYRVAEADLDEVLRALDHREKGGYARCDMPLTTAGDMESRAARTAIVYMATPDNPDYLGPAPLPVIAAQVLASHGPSGPNVEYVLRLADALASMNADDDHVFELARLLRARDRGESPPSIPPSGPGSPALAQFTSLLPPSGAPPSAPA
ncbi:gamma-glutamylcyclotransferase [Sorangium sp. So ce854]|uniref:gamma-glutamylcyclotransferase n=1 Tax=Sorangium sp. So ce854 TaxID=3133322 RepID=UPI003F5E185C